MNPKPIRKVLIANRGEIALRIIRTLNSMGIASVAVYHEQDIHAPYKKLAGEAWSLGNGALSDTYLNVEKIIAIALKSGANAIHPGYGFLSENPLLSEACEANGIIFIGPDAKTIRLMGNKIEARVQAQASGLPVAAGYTGSPEKLLSLSETLPYPVLVKAAAGGGGKGMRIVHTSEQLSEVIQTTSREALTYFGDGTVYVEQYINEPRHVEIQVLADQHGNVVHLFERECSIQRRYQKIIEESPSPSLDAPTRKAMGNAAVALCKSIGYRNAGTIEFLLDAERNFYFLEMNTRIQVEHPVTEMVTGIDLIEEQIRIAEGNTLRFTQSDIVQQGHAIECRIYAEDPENNFLPSPGSILAYEEPKGESVRIDSSIDGPAEISGMFDPMLSKLIVWSPTREEAIQKISKALKTYFIVGIKTNLPFLIGLMDEDDFKQNNISIAFVDKNLARIMQQLQLSQQHTSIIPAAVAMLIRLFFAQRPQGSVWHQIGYWRILPVISLQTPEKTLKAEILSKKTTSLKVLIENEVFCIDDCIAGDGFVSFSLNGTVYRCPIYMPDHYSAVVLHQGMLHSFVLPEVLQPSIDHGSETANTSNGGYFSPMPGKVIRVNVTEGEEVNRGHVLIVIEAMKMENNIVAVNQAIVEKIYVKVGDMVDTLTELILLKEIMD
jgi:acetyl-CoA carboxylase biotin carboxylase subunit